MPTFRRELLFSLIIALFCIALLTLDIARVPPAPEGIRCRALVTGVDNSRVRTNLIVKTNVQLLTVRLLSGPHEGQTVEVVNMLTGKMELDEFYEPGTTILIEYDAPEGKPANAVARGAYRLGLQLFLAVLFGLLLFAVAGVTGLKAGLSFVFAALVLWKLFFPLLLLGYPPLPTGLGIVALLTGVICFAVGGLTRRGTATFLGSLLGLLLTCGLAALFTHLFRLHGAVRPFAEMLLYSGYPQLNLTDIFVASVFIACSGAVMDLAMDIAATMDELKFRHPEIGLLDHMRSGLRVGRAVTGTMTTTLLLAYSGSHIAMFMVFLAKGLPPANLLNAPFVAAEVLNILVGSFGVIAVAPCTVVIAALLYRTRTAPDHPASRPG
ncbi:YibE/F family protein [Desulfobulbus elongatus]|uniref:YibE/F family protein n=1 Tax=Desulfobulbus elongatus TaxID=53332 RepID=UPI00048436A1|nr:YibE/F family protein [Desulfobulbus elongatus]